MRLLLDSHAWLWMLAEPEQLNEPTRSALADASNEINLSAASVWEIGIKYALGKLPLPTTPVGLVTISTERSTLRCCRSGSRMHSRRQRCPNITKTHSTACSLPRRWRRA